MKVGPLEDGMRYSLCIQTNDGARHLVHMQFIAQVDDRTGRYAYGIGVSPQRAVEILQRHGSISVVKGFSVDDGIEKVFLAEKIRRVFTLAVQPANYDRVFILDAPNKSRFGRFFAGLADKFNS